MDITSDIWTSVGTELISRGYWKMNPLEKQRLVVQELVVYTKNKMQDLGIDYGDVDSLPELLSIINDYLTLEEREMFFHNYGFYILGILKELQSGNLIWCKDEDEKLLDNLVINFAQDGKIDSLTTHIDSDPLKEVLIALYVYETHFPIRYKGARQRTISVDVAN